ncbi:MAG: ATP-dependent protease subunit HslV [Firmicutes bacterium]|nr:ATP-dependent protease subunit HslV [Bacillota bacterium]
MDGLHGTTIAAIKHKGKTVIAGDSQATLGDIIVKDSVVKVRRIYNDKVILGFAGLVSDAFVLLRMIESALQRFSGNLQRSVVEVAGNWQKDMVARKLEVAMLVSDGVHLYYFMGDGNVMEPAEGFASIGAGSKFALGAMHVMTAKTDMSAREIATEAVKIASKYCIYTNDHLIVEEI